MENLKIKVGSESESIEAQELFFQLGYDWVRGDGKPNNIGANLILAKWNKDLYLTTDDLEKYKEITIQELKDMVVLKRNDVADATHEDSNKYDWFVASNQKHYRFQGEIWVHQPYVDCLDLKPIQKQSIIDKLVDLPEFKIDKEHGHYFKDVSDVESIDVYEVLKRFGVTDPCLQHIVKKALCAGYRGHKDFERDLQDIYDTSKRALEINGIKHGK